MIYPRLLTEFRDFFCNRRLLVFLDGNSSQKYLSNASVPRSSIVDFTLCLLYTLPYDIVCNIGV